MDLTKIETFSEQETTCFAHDFAQSLCAGDVVLLQGDLGMGKSVFARAVVRSLCGDSGLAVPSPTFTLVQHYDGQNFSVVHFDLYRLSDPEDIYEIGWEDALSEGVALVEWPERLGHLKPRKCIEITFSSSHDNLCKRIIEIAYL